MERTGLPTWPHSASSSALAHTPFLVGVSIGDRHAGPKDTLANVRETGAFCVNVVTEPQLEAMNVTSGEYGTQIDEFEVAELRMAVADLVDAPYVDDCPAVIACRLFKEVDLGSAPNTLIIGEAVGIRLSTHLTTVGDTHFVDPDGLRPVGRLSGMSYGLLGEIVHLERPR